MSEGRVCVMKPRESCGRGWKGSGFENEMVVMVVEVGLDCDGCCWFNRSLYSLLFDVQGRIVHRCTELEENYENYH